MISTAIITCSNDVAILPFTIAHASRFSSAISVVYSHCLWNGKPDNWQAVETAIESAKNRPEFFKFCEVRPVLFEFEEWMGRTHSLNGVEPGMRQASVDAVDDADHCLLLDGDEVVDPILFADWMEYNKQNYHNIKNGFAVRFLCHYYFRTPRIRAIQSKEEAGLMIPKELFSAVASATGNIHIRSGFLTYPGYKTLVTFNGEPMIHHYSGVRSKATLISKVTAWTHRNDFPNTNWVELLEDEFSHEFDGTIPFHNYPTEVVEPFIDLPDYSEADTE